MSFTDIDSIKQKIVDGHRRGVCNKNGETDFSTDNLGRRTPRPRPSKGLNSSTARTYVYREGKMVLKG